MQTLVFLWADYVAKFHQALWRAKMPHKFKEQASPSYSRELGCECQALIIVHQLADGS
jgi:hypothetical protein